MAYKKLIKVSNVCQLLDKSKFLATQTINGVTFTNNGDGTITVNGTATGRTVFRFVFDRVIISKGAKLRFNNVLDVEAYNKFWVEVKLQYTDGTDKYIADVSITPSPPIKDVNEITGYIIINDGETVNETLTPQLFNLTEMYGAGHEPTSIEQFRQDFPEELYDYSPHCWLTSYKRVFMTGGGNYLTSYQRNLTCKTKNLFDINSVSNINNWVTSTTDAHPYGYYTFYLKPNTTYTFSRKYASNNDSVYACFSEEYGVADGQWFIHPTVPSLTRKQLSFTTNDTGIMYLNVYGIRSVMNSFIELIEGAQLELGSTATDYVPYGHL